MNQPKPSARQDRIVRSSPLVTVAILIAVLAAFAPSSAVEQRSASAGRLATPEDRYALAGGCYAVRSSADRYIIREGDGFAATATTPGDAEPFHFQATDLGRYLLFGTAQDFLAAAEGAIGTILNTVTGHPAGGIAGGLTMGTTDAAAKTVASGPLGAATGRASGVVAAKDPVELADWEIDQVSTDAFTIHLPATTQALTTDAAGHLQLVEAASAGESGTFGFELVEGCASFPEIELNVEGPVAGGATPFTEVRGFLDAHVHMMAFEFIGGRVRCGSPWHRYGVAKALVDCPDHYPGGQGAVLEMVLSGGNPIMGHDPSGWPSFIGWPRYNSLTHEQLYYRWLERAWRGGLRLFTNLLVDNHALCTAYPFKENSCNEMDGVRLQAQRLRELERYIDAQNGGPGEGWFRIVTDPFQARGVINSGKLAVIMGIEVSLPLDCGVILEMPQCDTAQIDEQLDGVYELGVRQMELANKFDNALTGITGDGGSTGVVVNTGNKTETGKYWQMETCPDDTHGHDNAQYNIHDEAGTPEGLTGRDSIFAGVLQVTGTSGVAPLYPPAPHCNVRGLTELGAHAVRTMIRKGMIFDPDHMSAYARHQALDILAEEGYSGVVSSHSWADDTIYPRVYELGGVVTPYAGGSQGFVDKWRQHKQWADDRFLFGFGYGSDVNGFGSQGGPRGLDAANKVIYPFTGFGGAVFDKQQSGTRTYDINADGVAHYGLYPDWIEDLRILAGDDEDDEIMADMALGAEAYLQMWERAIGVPPNACRSDVPDLGDGQLATLTAGMSPEAVVRAIGQPKTRAGDAFTYCMTANRTATVTFTPDGALESTQIAP